MIIRKCIFSLGMALALPLIQPAALAAPLAPVLERPAQHAVRPERSVLIDVARAGNRLVAVGERGIIVFSDDNGETWKQANTPVAATLVALTFVDEHQGWAVGHSGVVLHSSDGGANWTLQLDGNRAAQLILDAARGTESAKAARLEKLGALFVGDGPDKPFLDVVFIDAGHGWIVGAYGLIFRTDDGGRHWRPWLDRVENPDGMHIYALRYDPGSEGKRIYLAGEQGYFARSDDGGGHFKQITTPYEGSYFDLAVLPDGELLLGGLRGNLWRSSDAGQHFKQVQTPAAVSWNMVRPIAGGRVVLFNQAGEAYELDKEGASPRRLSMPAGLPLTGLAATADQHYVTVGLGGATRLDSLSIADIATTPPETLKP